MCVCLRVRMCVCVYVHVSVFILSLTSPLLSTPIPCVTAEPVEAASIDLFYAVFSPHGLKSDVMKPTYGLAEHTGQHLRYVVVL